jgi:hypothetical protein
MWISFTPIWRRLRIRLRLVVPRMMESSTMITRLPCRSGLTGLSFTRTPKSRIAWEGWMKVRPT